MKPFQPLHLIIGLLACVAAPVRAELAIIAHPACAASSISADEIKQLYLGKSKKLGDAKAVPVDQAKDSQVSNRFYETVVGKNASQVRAYWSKLVFTGKGRPPRQVGSDSDVLSAVAADPTLIGYVDAAAVNESVKVLLTVQ